MKMNFEHFKNDQGPGQNGPNSTDGGENLLSVTLVINGTPEVVSINQNAPLKTLVQKGLHESGNVGRPLEDWQLKLDGRVLELDKKLANYGIQQGAELFLSLKAGHGG